MTVAKDVALRVALNTADLNKGQRPDAEPVSPVAGATAEAQALRERNLEFFRKHLPAFYKQLGELKPATELVWQEDGDVNIRDKNTLVYKAGAKADARASVEAYKKRPSRIMYAKPALMFEPVDGAAPLDEQEEHEFATQRYDDRNTDDHADQFMRRAATVIQREGVRVTDGLKRDKPYFLVIYGLGLGYHIRPLVEHYKPEVVIIAESELETLYHSLSTFDWPEFHHYMQDRGQKIRLVLEQSANMMVTKIGGLIQGECLLGLDGVLSFQHAHTPTINVAFNEFNSPKSANLASFVGFTVDEFNMMKNTFRNLKAGTKRVLNLVRKPAGVPAIIVGSGPSLEENIEFLKKVQDRAVIISSGSSIAVLLKNGIKPDFQCVLERAKAVYDRHKEAAEQFDLSDIHVVLTTTIWPGIDSFFKDVIYFFRPALSPLGVFCRDNVEILNGEGPQVTNTSFAFAKRLGFSEIYMLGIDLGAADPSRPRAEKAWISPGVKQRNLTMPVRGNFGRTVFTDRSLTQQRQTIENQIRTMKDVRVYNLSNGVRIEGAPPRQPKNVELPAVTMDKTRLVQELVDQFPVYTRERFIGQWLSSGVRENVAEMVAELVKALEQAETWDNKLIKKLDEINAYVGKPLRKQYAPRLLRGSILRICMYVNSIFLRLEDPSQAPAFYAEVREELIGMFRQMEMEAYALADELESEDEYFAVNYE